MSYSVLMESGQEVLVEKRLEWIPAETPTSKSAYSSLVSVEAHVLLTLPESSLYVHPFFPNKLLLVIAL